MVLQNDREILKAAWRALAGGDIIEDGWLTTTIEAGSNWKLRAGRCFPHNGESILVGFNLTGEPKPSQLPQGKGFIVEKVEQNISGARLWVALCKKPTGNLDMFAIMVEDILCLLRIYDCMDSSFIFQIFIDRIRAWQEFMQRTKNYVLSSESEIGLFGELLFFKILLQEGIPVTDVLESWHGPLGGIQDFRLEAGAVEVKTTLSEKGFPAYINSLDQLNTETIKPLFLFGVRLSISESGLTLSQLIDSITDFLQVDLDSVAVFENLILHAGYLRSLSENYKRKFINTEVKIMRVDENFPRIINKNVDISVRSVCYVIDLDLIKVPSTDLVKLLVELGVHKNGTK